MYSIPAICSQGQTGSQKYILHFRGYLLMLPVYIYHKDGTFLYNTGLFHVCVSNSLREPVQIVKYVKNWHFIFGSAITVAREAW